MSPTDSDADASVMLTLDDLIAVALADGELWVAWWLIWWRHQRLTRTCVEAGAS